MALHRVVLLLSLVAAVAFAADDCHMVCPLIYDPVCGSDAQTYPSLCELSRHNCLARASVTVVKAGECTLEAACDDICALSYEPVCGTDGQVYTNECKLNIAACRARAPIRVAHKGECTKTETCAAPCEKILNPVCASNGKTYQNACLMVNAACELRLPLVVAHAGECHVQNNGEVTVMSEEPVNKCDTVLCAAGTVCIEDAKDSVRCVTPEEAACANSPCLNDEVCIYSPKQCFTTPCPQYECRKRVEVDYPTCATATCAADSICVPARHECFTTPCPQFECINAAKSNCPLYCPAVYKPVCGTDGITYSNDCDLSVANCLRKTVIGIARSGACEDETITVTTTTESSSCDDILCPAIYKPVCGSDGETYSNSCAFSVASCRAKGLLSIVSEGACAFTQPSCDEACIEIYQPVCASNGVTFSNVCELKRQACLTKSNLAVAHEGECESTTVGINDTPSDNAVSQTTIIVIVAVVGAVLLVGAVVVAVVVRRRRAQVQRESQQEYDPALSFAPPARNGGYMSIQE